MLKHWFGYLVKANELSIDYPLNQMQFIMYYNLHQIATTGDNSNIQSIMINKNNTHWSRIGNTIFDKITKLSIYKLFS